RALAAVEIGDVGSAETGGVGSAHGDVADGPPAAAQLVGPVGPEGRIIEDPGGGLHLHVLRAGKVADHRDVHFGVAFVHVVRALGGLGVEVAVIALLRDGVGDEAAVQGAIF